MPEKMIVLGIGMAKLLSSSLLVFSTLGASIVTIASSTPLGDNDMEALANGNAQQVLSIMLGICVIAILGLCGVIWALFNRHEKRHIMAHEERDKREASFQELTRKMIKATTEANEIKRESNQVLGELKDVVARCHDDTLILERGACKIHKKTIQEQVS